jgi:antagonist of KipI
MSATITIVRAGMLTTVQDLGRFGYQGLGVPIAGPMDWYSHRLANQLAENDPSAAALEITMIGPELQTDADVTCAVAGAAFDLTVDGLPIAADGPFTVPGGARLRFGQRRAGARATLAFAGGIDVPATFGSRATHIVSRMGPFGGRQLRAGDQFRIGASHRSTPGAGRPLPLPSGSARVRILPAPHRARFTDGAWTSLLESSYLVTPQSNRMGYRLEGAALAHVSGADILSEATPIGSLQVPASGQPILLMADRQTTGGYTVIATVITADLPLAGQLAPGDNIAFVSCTREDAFIALRQRMEALAAPRGARNA